MAQGRVFVYGGKGALGSVVVNFLKSKNYMDVSITNETVCSIRVSSTDDDCIQHLSNADDAFLHCNKESLRKKIGDTFRKHAILKRKNNKKKLSEFLCAPFTAPQQAVGTSDSHLHREVARGEVRIRDLVSQLEHKTEQLHTTKEALAEVQSAGHEESRKRHKAETEKCQLEAKAARLEEEAALSKKNSVRNLTKKLKRKEEKIKTLERENELLTQEKKAASITAEKTNKLKHELHTKQKHVSYLKQRIRNILNEHKSNLYDIKELEVLNNEKDKEIVHLQQAADLLCEQDDSKVLETKSENKYNDQVREVCMQLMCRLNVSIKKVPEVIRLVLGRLADLGVGELPSQTTLSRLYTEANVIAKKHVATEMLKEADDTGATGAVLHQDATTKFSTHVEGMQTTLPSGKQMTMALEEVATGDAAAYLRVYENAIDDLAEMSSLPFSDAKDKLIASFKSFMNDQCSVNGVLTKAIEELRKDVLPRVLNLSAMTPEKRQQAEEMGHYACRMHLLANFATAADKGIAAYEEVVAHGTNPHSFKLEDQSGSLRLIRTAAKAFTKRGSDRSGVNTYFESFVQNRQRQNTMLTYLGHRFNIMFVNAAAVFYHREDIVDFLDTLPDPNRLLKSIKWDIKEKVYLAGLRALGLLSKFVFEPFHRLLLSTASIFDLNIELAKLQETFEKLSQDGSDLMNGIFIFDEKHYPDEDVIRSELLKDTGDCEIDTFTQIATELVCGELLVLLERQAHTQLPGGDLANPDEGQKHSAKNVPTHNLLSERDMACYDNILRMKPAASMSAIEASVMWQNNKTDEWLKEMSEEERSEVFTVARETRKQYSLKIKGRLERLKEEKLGKLKKKQQQKEEKEELDVEARLKVIREVRQWGGMWEKDEVDEKLDDIETEQDMHKAVQAQIRYHKVVVKAAGQRSLFQFSEHGQMFSTTQLVSNLKEILSNEDKPSGTVSQQVGGLQRLSDYKETAEIRKQEIFASLLNARKKRQNVHQTNTLLPFYLNDPKALVGRNIFHKCRVGTEVEWFGGKVTGIVKSARIKSTLKTEYNIIYDSTPEDTWYFPLLSDLKKGDLVVV